MTAVVLPVQGRWAWDARGEGRAVRVATHPESGVVNLSLWREDTCVGTARLRPDDVAELVTGLTEGLAALAACPRVVGAEAGQLASLQTRVARLEERRTPLWRQAATAATGWVVRKAARQRR
jgi:hypothetical protein